jgi:acyl-CoA thioester hydrolase
VIEAPLALFNAPVVEAWLDYNGHMSESCYLLVVGEAADAFFRYVWIDDYYRAGGHSLYTAETHLHHLREAGLGDRLEATLQVLDLGPKSLHLFHCLTNEATGEAIATAEQLLVHVDMTSGRAVRMPDELFDKIAAIRDAHADVPRPAAVGHVMGIRRPAE